MPGVFHTLRRGAVRTFQAAVAGPTVLFYDTFTGANGTLITARAPDIDTVGGGWVQYKNAGTGDFSISSNKCVLSAGASQNYLHAVAQTNVADVTITGDLTHRISGASESLVGRCVNTSAVSLWRALLLGGNMVLQEANAGAFTQRAISAGAQDGITYACTLAVSGASIQFTAATIATLSYTSTQHQTNTRHGILFVTNIGGTSGIVDDFRVTA